MGLPLVGAAFVPAQLLSPNQPVVLLGSLLIALGLIVAWAYGLMWIVRKKASRSEG
jgi:flagellar biogenesis protein FliO